MIKVEVQGLQAMEQALNTRIKNLGKFTPKAMTDIILDLLGRAVRDAPVDLGDLRGSGFADIETATGTQRIAEGRQGGVAQVDIFKGDGKTITGVIGFTEPYALRQHEEITWRHPKGGKAKYLGGPFNENKDKYIEHLTKSIKKAVE